MKADILREKFLNFFRAKAHKVIESDSLIPRDDPTVLFTPAGMNQFKKEFMGYDAGYKRAATSQRCLRTDDLDKVGRTTGHHTFFEMLGNFSFGDYFKQEAIAWAWEFLTKELKLNTEALWVSVYEQDDEAYEIWKDKIGIPAQKIVKLGQKENFWPANAVLEGPNGPCGPCSEIFYDFGKDKGCQKPGCSPACSCGRFVEIWNLVFTQFNRKEDATLEPLPNKNIDTGMGLERLAAVMQGAPNNFETDLFKPLLKAIDDCRGGFQTRPCISEDKKKSLGLVYAIADHIRAAVFAIYDGALPSNEGRGYVIRKIIRKSVLHLRALGIEKPFLYKLVPVIAEIMKAPYPLLHDRREEIAAMILAEEKNFINTLSAAPAVFKEKFSAFIKKPDAEQAGMVAFEVHDTYGIPMELTRDWLDKQGIKVSEEAFNRELDKQKTRSKLKSNMKGDVFDVKALGLTLAATKFLGYKEYEARAKILKIIKGGVEVKKINKGESADIVLDQTPFYPESGGQVGDTGLITKGKNIFEAADSKKAGKATLHIGKVKIGSLKIGDLVTVRINKERRLSIARNHTATHLLQAALRKALGAHVQQQGSLVAEDKFRFDFTHFKAVGKEELEAIENTVYGFIIEDLPVSVKQMPLTTAKKSGALAFFGEKYGSKVRVISIGDISKEFCGGTHLKNTGQIGYFKIIKEGSVASGVRRIEGTTGTFARAAVSEERDNLAQEIERLRLRVKVIEKQKSGAKTSALKDSVTNLLDKAENINNIKVITWKENDLDMPALRSAMDAIKQKANNTVACLGSAAQGRGIIVLGLTEDLCKKGLDASKMITALSAHIGGSGGGRADFAQAGGGNPEGLDGAFDELKKIIKETNP
ncbi:MAG: alanine--tRNA ligase [Candidatus Omnitrophota bacterium]|nr:alanine--tRNA ligase [Candidatus Omnitrophota bacterium]